MSNLLSSIVQYPRLFQLAFVLGIGGTFQYGYQISVLNSPSPYIKSFINETWLERYGSPISGRTLTALWSLIVSAYGVGGLLGAMSSGYLIGLHGKKKVQVCNSLLPVLAFVLMACSKIAGSFEMILIGRFICGLNAGTGFNIHSQYVSEIAPKMLRGVVTVTCPFFITLGKFCGQIMGQRELFGTEDLWPYITSVSAFASLVQFASLPFFPETPRYLLMEKQDEGDCMRAIKQLWGEGDHHGEMEDMKKERAAMKTTKIMSVLSLLRDRSLRLQLYVLISLMFALQFSGINAINFYSYEVFQQAGFTAEQIPYIILCVGACEGLSTVLTGHLIERCGRRPLILVFYSIIILDLALLTVSLSLEPQFHWLRYISIALILLYTLFFGLGPGGVTLTVCTEIFTQSSRTAAMGILGTLNWVELCVIGMLFPYMEDALGQFCFLVFLTCVFITVCFCYLFLPETKGRSVLEITEEFHKFHLPWKRASVLQEHLQMEHQEHPAFRESLLGIRDMSRDLGSDLGMSTQLSERASLASETCRETLEQTLE